MLTLDDSTSPLVVGDDYDVEREVVNVPSGDALLEAWLTIKKSEFDPDADAVIQKHITETLSPGVGQITETGDSVGAVGNLVFQLTAADTALLDPYEQYSYDIQVKTINNKLFTRESGILVPQGQITRTS